MIIDETDLYAHLAEVSLDDPSSFAQSVLGILRGRFDLAAASLYIYTAESASLRLRAQVGFDYRDYEGFDLPLESFAGKAIASGEPVTSRVLRGSPLFWNKKLLASAEVDAVVAVPLTLAEPSAALATGVFGAGRTIGAMCLYLKPSSDIEGLLAPAVQYAPFVARLYLSTIERAAMRLRRKTVERVAYRNDVGSLAHTFLNLVREELSVEGAALWVLDARRNLLYRRRALPPRTPDSPGILPSDTLSGDSLIARCFRSAESLRHDAGHPLPVMGDVDLAHASPLANWTAIPIKLPPDAKLRGRTPGAAGVLELVNHFTSFGTITHLTTPSWEDSYFAEFACELLSVLIYQVLRTQDHEIDFERLLHGARTSLQAARSHLQALEGLDLEEHLPHTHRHFIPNAIDWLEDLEAQINRDDIVNKAQLELEPISLYGDVLAKLEPMVKRMNTRNEHRPMSLHGIGEIAQNYLELPRVLANRQALDCVFRNLLDNSRKYCRPTDGSRPDVWIRLLVDEQEERLVILLSDNGEGVDPEEAELIFEDGFRGAVARGLQPQGVGRGLYDCDRLMRAMRGSVSVLPGSSGTMFRMELETVKPSPRR